MPNQKENSTFLIKSSQNRSFGTGFCIYKDERGSYIVTCAHVVDECGVETMLIEGRGVKLKAKGESGLLDLALLYVEGLVDTIALEVDFSDTLEEELTPFEITGFKPHKQESYKLETLGGSIEKISTVYTDFGSLPTYELTINGNDSIEKGYSGSAVISSTGHYVIAVATDRNRSGKEGYAIPLYHLKSIWNEIPKALLVKREKAPPVKQKEPTKKPKRFDFLLPFVVILGVLIFVMNRIYPYLNLEDTIYVLALVALVVSEGFVYIKMKIKEKL